MAKEVFSFGFKAIQKLDDGQFRCNKCSKKFKRHSKIKRHYSTLHKDENRNLTPGNVSKAIASKTKTIEDVAERLEVSEGRLVSFIKNSQHFYIRRRKTSEKPRIAHTM